MNNGAHACCVRLRNQTPSIFNPRRLRELPIPNFQPIANNHELNENDQNDQALTGSSNDNPNDDDPNVNNNEQSATYVPTVNNEENGATENGANENGIQNRTTEDTLNENEISAGAVDANTDENNFAYQSDDEAIDGANSIEFVKTETRFDMSAEDEIECNNIFASDSEADVEILGESVPMPQRSNVDGLIKHENDSISGSMPFNVLVCMQPQSINKNIRKSYYDYRKMVVDYMVWAINWLIFLP